MNYLILILSGIIGFLIYYIYRKETTKTCPYCGESIKKKAILCRYCNTDLINPVEKVTKDIEVIKEKVIDSNIRKLSTKASLHATKSILETQIFILKGVSLLTKFKNK